MLGSRLQGQGSRDSAGLQRDRDSAERDRDSAGLRRDRDSAGLQRAPGTRSLTVPRPAFRVCRTR